jgi:hypothetical protein
MGPGPRRTGFNSSGLVRLLAELTTAESAGSQQTFAERLGQWLGWTDAAALAQALHAPATRAVQGEGPAAAGRAAQALARLRAELVQSVETDAAWLPPRARLNPVIGASARPLVPDFASLRQACAAQQAQMAWRIAPLRSQLRETLVRRGGELARLAALDAVMEQVLAERERSALAAMPGLLAQRFERLRAAQPAAADDAGLAWSPGGWLHRFSQDMQALLRAEIELRLLPLQGLVETLDDPLNRPLATTPS